MSYNKAMKFANNYAKKSQLQPCLGMPFDDLKENQHIESSHSLAIRTAESYHVRANINNEWVKISEDFIKEENAIDESFELDKIYNNTRIYSDKGMCTCGW